MIKHQEDSIARIRKEEDAKDAEIRLLKAQLQAAAQRQDFMEDCVAEMAAQVYNV